VQQTKDAITTALGDSNRHVPRVTFDFHGKKGEDLNVRFAVNDNLAYSLIVDGAQGDVQNILKAVKHYATWGYGDVGIVGTFPIQDNLGNYYEREVINLIYSPQRVRQMNLDYIPLEKIFAAADWQSVVHPDFK
jgi:hypothetical protein